MDAKEVTLICSDCGEEAAHLVWSRMEQDKTNGLPYIQCHRRCLACGAEHPTPEELAQHNVGPKQVAECVRASADKHSNFGTE